MKIPINPERIEGEGFENYKKRQKLVNKAIKRYKKGQLIWISQKGEIYVPIKKEGLTKEEQVKELRKENWGTFRRKDHIPQIEKMVETKVK